MINGHGFCRCDGFNLKAAPGTLFPLTLAAIQSAFPGRRFIPLNCFGVVRTKAGTVTTAAVLRVGTNANHDNVCPNFTLPVGTPVGRIGPMPLAAPLESPQLDALDLWLELVTAGVGPTVYTADLVLYGLVVG